MAESRIIYTTPIKTDRMPPGIPFIIGNEAAERFCFYGLRAILVIYMTQYLRNRTGALATMSESDANFWYHLFVASNYFFPTLGAVISDAFWGKYRTIFWLSLVYCIGCVALAADPTRVGLFAGLGLIALGSGGIKPCVSSHVGDQFGATNQGLLARAFGWFYFSINFGSTFSILLVPWLLEHYGAGWAFGVPAALMFVATVVFWSGRDKFAHIPPGGKAFLRETFSPEGLAALGRLAIIFAFVAVFWSLWDQSGGEWVLQAEKMDLHFMGITWLSSQVQAVNAVMILSLIPVFNYWIYPAIDRVFPLTPLRKIGIGLAVTATSFVVSAWIESQITQGLKPNIGWQLPAYLLLSAGEVMVSITSLEFAYTQSPKTMKSIVMALFLLSITAGNLFTAAVQYFIQNPDHTTKLPGAWFYSFFAGLCFLTSIVFAFVSRGYRGRTYMQEEAPLTETEAEAAVAT